MPGLVPGIHVLAALESKAWMAGTSPTMTRKLRVSVYGCVCAHSIASTMASRSFGRSSSTHSMNARIELARTAKRLRLSASACSADTGSLKDGCFKPGLTLLPVRLHGRPLLSQPPQSRGPSIERTSIHQRIFRTQYAGRVAVPGEKPGLNHQKRSHPLIAYSSPSGNPEPNTASEARRGSHPRMVAMHLPH